VHQVETIGRLYRHYGPATPQRSRHRQSATVDAAEPTELIIFRRLRAAAAAGGATSTLDDERQRRDLSTRSVSNR